MLRESSFTIFADLAGLLGPDQFRGYFAVICDILKNGLLDPKTYNVRLSALLATSSFLQLIEDDDAKNLNMFRPLLPQMLDCVNVALQHQKEDDAQDALEVFVELADNSSAFFKPSIQIVVKNMFEIISTPSFEDGKKKQTNINVIHFSSLYLTFIIATTIIIIIIRYKKTCAGSHGHVV